MAQVVTNTYAASSALTITLASLATSSTLVAGRQSAEFSLGGALGLLLSAKITTGTSPTAGEIDVYIAGLEDGTNYPDTISTADANRTMTSTGIRDACLRLAARMPTDTTSNRAYYSGPIDIEALFGGVPPQKIVVWVTHNTGVNLNATGGNHFVVGVGVTQTIT